MKTEVINPNVKHFIKSLRDIGYSFDVAVADIIDNSITAKASSIQIHAAAEPDMILSILDDGDGMSSAELVEAMRLATRDPDEIRVKSDLGRFGLGLKTASFSQCKKLTVISKKNGIISARLWDLDYIGENNAWLLIAPDEYDSLPLVDELKQQDSGTIVVWQNVDRYSKNDFTERLDKLRKHLALVFHRFLSGKDSFHRLKIYINNNQLKAFNPFNIEHTATQEIEPEKIKLYDFKIIVAPFILPHHSKISQQEYARYATEEGYTRSQGFYLYRANRLLIYGTWWGLHKLGDAYNLVRIKIDIENDQDSAWGIDIKKSTASPSIELKKDLRRIIRQVTAKGSRPYTGRGRKIEDKTTTRFWHVVPKEDELRFAANQDHPVYQKLISVLSKESLELLDIYLKGLQAYLPLESIQAHLHENPHKIKQENALPEEEVKLLADKLLASELDKEYVDSLLKTELFSKRKELLRNDS
jgi:hypothetical protein